MTNIYLTSKKDNLIITFFVLSLFCTGINVYAVVYPIFNIGCLLGFIGVFLQFSFSIRIIKASLIIKCFVFLFFIWLCFALLSSMLNIDENGRVVLYSFKYIVFFLIFIFISLIKKPIGYLFFKRYSEILYLISFVSFISFSLNAFNFTSSTELGLIDGRIYHSTFFNVYMSAVELGEFTLARFQSIFYEPGTFAFLLLPVIFWYKIIEYKPFEFLTLILMLLFTFSVGAILTAIAILIIYSFIQKPVKFFPYFFILLGVFLLSLSIFPVFLDFLSNKFGLGIYQGTHTSGGTRIQELRYVGEALESVVGSGFSGLLNVDTFGGNISVGFFQMIIYSGLIGAVALIIFHVILGGYSLQKLASKNNRAVFIGSSLFSFISMGLQRGTFMDAGVLIIIFAFLLRFDSEMHKLNQ